ncbi:bromoperoxidase [Rhodophyticola sp. CCM32]|uniref:bromoperoxidase n=1 Tax=Rhodophyticola sp. CCM32 TaxID=2916397 RepID=UPI00107FBA81|nr:bromoperoxidase [Rhodophyticola sp. CCM32]QBY00240.1 bromoperoxidase [Rhodophyticola sp. CCM32]
MKFNDPNRDPRSVRNAATELSTEAPLGDHLSNDDEQKPYLFSFTKGLGHGLNGLLSSPQEFEQFTAGTQTHEPTAFADTVPYRGDFPGADLSSLPVKQDHFRRWESPTAGHAYVMEGPDPYAVTMPPAPEVGSAEFGAEMAEVYQMALSRDWAVASFMDESLIQGLKDSQGNDVSDACRKRISKDNEKVADAAKRLSEMRWFMGTADDNQSTLHKQRRRHGKPQSADNIFRGAGEDSWSTPFLSQFMVMGSGGASRDLERRLKGKIQYGAQRIPQEVRVAKPGKDYMTGWQDWLNVQNGLNARATLPGAGDDAEFVDDAYRPMARLRDLATYVHDDALYQAYLNAALIMLDERFDLDLGIPYHGNAKRKFPFPGAMPGDNNRTPFALFGPPHLLTLVTEVSSRALKAVRLQKFSVHRRLRPEAAGALFHTVYSGYEPHWDDPNSQPYGANGDMDEERAREMLAQTVAAYTFPQDATVQGSEPVLEDILTDIRKHNEEQNGSALKNSWLLPMAFPEGSPMHPAYGAGHATVAGACVTLLKAFFAMKKKDGTPVYVVELGEAALVPDCGTKPEDPTIDLLAVQIDNGLTLEGELNKLMWNISNGRNVAGVHYYTDYIESALLGEAITIGILREQMLAYHPDEQVEMTVPLIVPRTLPASLLSGQTLLTEADIVSAVKINSDGSLSAA